MLINIKDSRGIEQEVSVRGVESVADKSSTITTTNTSQQVMAANPLRSGFLIQNTGLNNMWVREGSAATSNGSSILLTPGATFSSFSFPLIQSALSIYGTANDSYCAREW